MLSQPLSAAGFGGGCDLVGKIFNRFCRAFDLILDLPEDFFPVGQIRSPNSSDGPSVAGRRSESRQGLRFPMTGQLSIIHYSFGVPFSNLRGDIWVLLTTRIIHCVTLNEEVIDINQYNRTQAMELSGRHRATGTNVMHPELS
jgi:hypothetical protein